MSTDFGAVKKPARKRLYDLLSDRQWHAWRACRTVGGMRYSARMLELKREGWIIESRGADEDGKEYRLIGAGTPKGKKVRVFLPEAEVKHLLSLPGVSPTAQSALDDALGSYQANRGKL